MKLGPYAIEQDYSHYVANASNIRLAVVGTASKGEIGIPTICTSPLDLTNKFGAVHPDHLGLYAANFFLAQSSEVWYVRAASASAAPAKVAIAGTTTGAAVVDEALVLYSKLSGTAYNGYSVIVSSESDLYTFVVKDASSRTIETISNVPFDELINLEFKTLRVDTVSTTASSLTAGTYSLAEGNNGTEDILPADYINAGNTLRTDNIDINLISVPGVTDPSVIVAMLTLAENRGDALFLVDAPKGLSDSEVMEWHNGGSTYQHVAFNSSYGALYYDWQQIYDNVNKTYVEVPPSVVVAPMFAYSTKISEIWFAPAGLRRGLIKGVIKPVTAPDSAQVEMLYNDTNAVNCIINDPQVGLCVFGQKTLYRNTTALNRVNVRMLLNYLKKVVVAACRHLTFEPNDRVTWNNFEDLVEPTLRSIKNRRGLYDYKIIKGRAIVTDEDIDNYRMPCKILIKPTKSAEEIPIYFTITNTGADFSDVLEEDGIRLES